MGQIMKKGQFFMISLIVISIVLIMSLSYANSANLMSVENQDYTSKLHFEIVKHAYDSAVSKSIGETSAFISGADSVASFSSIVVNRCSNNGIIGSPFPPRSRFGETSIASPTSMMIFCGP